MKPTIIFESILYMVPPCLLGCLLSQIERLVKVFSLISFHFYSHRYAFHHRYAASIRPRDWLLLVHIRFYQTCHGFLFRITLTFINDLSFVNL